MHLWEITTAREARWLYVELNGKYLGTWDEYRLRVIEARAEDFLALYSSYGCGLNTRPAKGDLLASATVQDLAIPYESPNR